jgi:hypothetical protein
MKIRVSQATRRQLDWMVAKCERADHLFAGHEVGRLHYTSNWAEGGPLIERKGISVFKEGNRWVAAAPGGGVSCTWLIGQSFGPTPLVAAMRCLVSSNLGDVVDVPDELIEDAPTEEAPSPPRPAP